MEVARIPFLARITRAAIASAGVVALLALHPDSARLVKGAWAWAARRTTAGTLAFSDQARRYLRLQYRSYPTEFMGCMLGDIQGESIVVRRIAPADVDPAQSALTHVVPKQTCEAAGWVGTVGVIHSHPSGQGCWYYFPGTTVLSSDGQSFLHQAYAVDAIMCGDRVVWIGRDMAEKQLNLIAAGDRNTPATAGR